MNSDIIFEGLQKPTWVIPVNVFKDAELAKGWQEIQKAKDPKVYAYYSGEIVDGIMKPLKTFPVRVTATT